MKKILLIRADADADMGTGHIMRCIALAQAWQQPGDGVAFLSRCESEALRQRIIDEGFDFISVKKHHPDPSDLSQTLSVLKRFASNAIPHGIWLVCDGYHFTPNYHKAVRDNGYRLLVIDDMAHLNHYHADILLNQNINAPDLNYRCDEDTTLLLGTRYALLRREFLKYRNFKRQIPDRAKNILVTLGGADPDNLTLKVIEALEHLDEPDVTARIIIGPANLHQETLRKALASCHFQADLLINPPNMPELMGWADLAVSASGSTCWELAYMGLPAIVIVLAENQKGIAADLDRAGVVINLKEHTEVAVGCLAGTISSLIKDHELRQKMSLRAKELVDGQGSKRMVQMLVAEPQDDSGRGRLCV